MALYVPKKYADWIVLIASIVTANLSITDVYGNTIYPNFRVGGFVYTFEQLLAIFGDAVCQEILKVDIAHRISTAVGDDLDEFGVLLRKPRKGNVKALVPVKYTRLTVTASPITINAGLIIPARDKSGTQTVQLTTQQDPTQELGVSAIIPASQSSIYGWALYPVPGDIGNIPAGNVLNTGSNVIPGVDVVSNPHLVDPTTPSVVPHGTPGSAYAEYSVVARGVTGRTNVCVAVDVSGVPNTLNSTDYIALTTTAISDAVSYDWLKATSIGGEIRLLANTSTPTYNDQGAATASYSLPTSNTANMGIGGEDPEDDEVYRARLPLSIEEDTSTLIAIEQAIKDIPGVSTAYAEDYDSYVAQYGTTGIYTPPVGIVHVDIIPVTSPIPTGTVGDLGSQIDAAVARTKAAGISVNWSEIIPVTLNVTYELTVTKGSASSIGASLNDVNDAMIAYVKTLKPGEFVRLGRMLQAVQNAISNNPVVIASDAQATVTNFIMQAGASSPVTFGDFPTAIVGIYRVTNGSITASIVGG